jgi:hypothetical protein
LISLSDRRVLDIPDPDLTQSARDRQPSHNRHHGQLQGPRQTRLRSFSIQPNLEFSITSFRGERRKRLAKPRPVRLAYQLEARPCEIVGARHAVPLPHFGQFTILSNVTRYLASTGYGQAPMKAKKFSTDSTRSTSYRESFQETTSTQWQKN